MTRQIISFTRPKERTRSKPNDFVIGLFRPNPIFLRTPMLLDVLRASRRRFFSWLFFPMRIFSPFSTEKAIVGVYLLQGRGSKVAPAPGWRGVLSKDKVPSTSGRRFGDVRPRWFNQMHYKKLHRNVRERRNCTLHSSKADRNLCSCWCMPMRFICLLFAIIDSRIAWLLILKDKLILKYRTRNNLLIQTRSETWRRRTTIRTHFENNERFSTEFRMLPFCKAIVRAMRLTKKKTVGNATESRPIFAKSDRDKINDFRMHDRTRLDTICCTLRRSAIVYNSHIRPRYFQLR